MLDDQKPAEQLTFNETLHLAVKFCILWFLANYFANSSLGLTNVPSFTILSATCGFFTLFVGMYVGTEHFTWVKFGALLISIIGVSLVASQDSQTSAEHSVAEVMWGDTFALFAAAIYGGYTSLLKFTLKDETQVSMLLFFGLIGVSSIVLIWPGWVLLVAMGWEEFSSPANSSVWIYLVLSLVLNMLGDVIFVFAMLLTSPLVAALSLSLTIPLSMGGDFILKGHQPTAYYWFGAMFVFVGFLIINRHGSGGIEDALENVAEDVEEGYHPS